MRNRDEERRGETKAYDVKNGMTIKRERGGSSNGGEGARKSQTKGRGSKWSRRRMCDESWKADWKIYMFCNRLARLTVSRVEKDDSMAIKVTELTIDCKIVYCELG